MHTATSKEASIGYLVHEVARLLRRRFEDEARVHGLTLPQWRVIAELHRQQGIPQVALAGCIDSDPMTLSGILDRLEKRGLVRRVADPSDSRAKLVRLTEDGLALYQTAHSVGRAVYEAALEGLSLEHRDVITTGLGQIRANLLEAAADHKEAV